VHRFFDHTGDFGAELSAPTERALFEELARAWLDLLTDAPASVAERETRPLEVSGIDAEDVLVALGNELLYLFETEGFLAARIDVTALDSQKLTATAHGEPFDPARHPIARPVKAVTHHGAEVVRAEDGWRARVIFDL
jgi:SHS2 domain-containing protein